MLILHSYPEAAFSRKIICLRIYIIRKDAGVVDRAALEMR